MDSKHAPRITIVTMLGAIPPSIAGVCVLALALGVPRTVGRMVAQTVPIRSGGGGGVWLFFGLVALCGATALMFGIRHVSTQVIAGVVAAVFLVALAWHEVSMPAAVPFPGATARLVAALWVLRVASVAMLATPAVGAIGSALRFGEQAPRAVAAVWLLGPIAAAGIIAGSAMFLDEAWGRFAPDAESLTAWGLIGGLSLCCAASAWVTWRG